MYYNIHLKELILPIVLLLLLKLISESDGSGNVGFDPTFIASKMQMVFKSLMSVITSLTKKKMIKFVHAANDQGIIEKVNSLRFFPSAVMRVSASKHNFFSTGGITPGHCNE